MQKMMINNMLVSPLDASVADFINQHQIKIFFLNPVKFSQRVTTFYAIKTIELNKVWFSLRFCVTSLETA
jgi:hypothetical protein